MSFERRAGRGCGVVVAPPPKHPKKTQHTKKTTHHNKKKKQKRGFEDELGDGACPLDVELLWMAEASSAVYATPLITDLYADGTPDVVVPSFSHYVDVLEAPSGARALGWPAFHSSAAHASPLLHDWDLDGVRDVLVATYDGDVLFFKDTVWLFGGERGQS